MRLGGLRLIESPVYERLILRYAIAVRSLLFLVRSANRERLRLETMLTRDLKTGTSTWNSSTSAETNTPNYFVINELPMIDLFVDSKASAANDAF